MPAASGARRPAFLNWTSQSDDFTNVKLYPQLALDLRRARVALVSTAILAGLLLAGCASSGQPSRKEQARANWNEARARVLLNLASDQYAHGNLVDARKTVSDGLKLSDSVAGLFILQAKLDIEDGQLQSASNALKLATRLAPRDPEPHYLNGIVAERWQQGEEALASYRQASQRAPAEMAYLLAVAESLLSLDRAPEAAAALEERLVFFESSAPIRDMLGQIYQEMDRHADAAELYRQASVLAPEDAAIRERHALALVQACEWRKAADVLERLLSRPEHAEQASLNIALAECRLQQGNASAARAAFTKATRIDPKSATAWLGVGKSALATGELERVEYAIQQVEAQRPTGRTAADVALLRGYLHLKQDRVEEAARSFAAAGRIEPQDPMPQVMYGLCQQRLGKTDEAKRYYTQALKLDPDDTLARELLNALARTDTDPLP